MPSCALNLSLAVRALDSGAVRGQIVRTQLEVDFVSLLRSFKSSHRPSPRPADRRAAPTFFQFPRALLVNEGQRRIAALSSRRSGLRPRPAWQECEAQTSRSGRLPLRPLQEDPNPPTKSPYPHNEAGRRKSSGAP